MTTPRHRRAVAVSTTLTALVLAGCTASPAPPGTSETSPAPASSSAPRSTPTTTPATTPAGTACPEPTTVTTPQTDFPQPPLTRYPVDPTTQAADDQLAAQGLAATRTFGGPIAATAFQHYLDATGSYLTLPVDDLLTATPALVTALDAALVTAGSAAVRQVLAGPPASCTAVPFASDWLVYADLRAGDWYATLGGFRYRVFGTAIRAASGPTGTDAGVRVVYRAAVGDTYDFDAGSTFEAFGRLALHGRAADFLDGGLTTAVTTTVRTSGAGLASPGFG